MCLTQRRQYRRALDLFSEGLSIAARLDNHSRRSSLVCNLIDTAIDLRDQATASRYLRSTLETPAADEPALMAYFAEAAILAI